jgi:NAD(P)H-dependent FMN reductase
MEFNVQTRVRIYYFDGNFRIMPHIIVLSSSVRLGRNSHRVALFFKNFVESKNLATAEVIDLNAYQFPVFNERLKYQKDPAPNVIEFAGKVKAADGLIIVTPEYNGGYPAALKNVVDLLYDEWQRKPIAISTVSDGSFGGTQVITSLQFSLWKIRAWTVAAMFPVPKVREAFDESGKPADVAGVEKRATIFVNELLWCIEAKKRMEK